METTLSDLHRPDETVEAPPLVDLLLRAPDRLDAWFADPARAAAVMPRLVAVSLAGMAGHGIAMGALASQVLHEDPLVYGARVTAAYAAGFFGAQIAGLPSAWFYALLAGLRTPAWRVAAEATRAQATSALVLAGVLPVYVAAALGLAVVDPESWPAKAAFWLGYGVPWVAGLAGTGAMYAAFRRQVHHARADGAPRTPTPLLLVLAWGALFTAMAPLGVYRVLTALG